MGLFVGLKFQFAVVSALRRWAFCRFDLKPRHHMVGVKPRDGRCHGYIKDIIGGLSCLGDGVVQQGLPVSFTAPS